MENVASVSKLSAEKPSCSAVAESLSHGATHSKLMEVFRRSAPTTGLSQTHITGSTSQTSTFSPSALPSKVLHGQKKSLKLARKSTSVIVRECKPITVTLLPSNTYSVPKEKEKKQLRDKGHVNCCYLSKEDTIDEVRLKLVKAFPALKNEMVAFMQATRSGDLFICEKDVINTGADVLGLTASSGLYITTLAAQQSTREAASTQLSSSVVQVIVRPRQGHTPRLVVSPHIRDKSTIATVYSVHVYVYTYVATYANFLE